MTETIKNPPKGKKRIKEIGGSNHIFGFVIGKTWREREREREREVHKE